MCASTIIAFFLKYNYLNNLNNLNNLKTYKNKLTQTEVNMNNPIFEKKIFTDSYCQTETVIPKLMDRENVEEWHKLIWINE